MIRSILDNKHWGRGSQHGIQMQPSWRVYNSYVAAREAYARHAILCHLYHMIEGEPPPGCEGITPSNLLPDSERVALTMFREEKATWDEASVASGIPVENLRELVKRTQEQLADTAYHALLRFENEALGPSEPNH